jgi:hypothetical protein
MKKIFTIYCIVLIYFINPTISQETIKFDEKSVVFTAKISEQARKLYRELNYNHELIINVLTKKEQKKFTERDKINYSRVRVKKLADFYKDSLAVEPYDLLLQFIPFEIKGKKEDGFPLTGVTWTQENMKKLTSRKGYYQLVITKSGNLVASGYINDTINGVTRRIFKKDQSVQLYGRYAQIYIPANSFNCDCDDIKLELKEFFTPSEMLLAGLTTTSGDKTLMTGGMIHIMAYCNGKEVPLKKGAKANINFFTINESFGVFFGKEKNNIIDWTLDKEIKAELNSFEFEDEMEGGGEGLTVLTDKLGWINCDAFVNEGPTTELLVDLQKPTDSTYVRLIFLDMKSILPGYFTNSENSKAFFKDIPKGKETNLLVYKIINKTHIHWAIADIKTGEDTFITDLKYKTSTKDEFKKIVDQTW